MSNRNPVIERRFVETPRARIHIAAAGSGRPVLLLHQTPRSWDEYRDVLPRLGRHYRAIAMDTVGFGDSDALPFEENSIEAWSACAFDLLDAPDPQASQLSTKRRDVRTAVICSGSGRCGSPIIPQATSIFLTDLSSMR